MSELPRVCVHGFWLGFPCLYCGGRAKYESKQVIDERNIKQLTAERDQLRARVAELEALLAEVRSVLDTSMGDTDAFIPDGYDEEDLRNEFPIEYCCQAISRAINK